MHPVPKPGESPFATPQGGSTLMMVGQLVGSLGTGVVLLPAVVLGFLAYGRGGAALTTASVAIASSPDPSSAARAWSYSAMTPGPIVEDRLMRFT